MEEVYREIFSLMKSALKEDIRDGDVTSEACIVENEMISAEFVCKQEGRIAGLPFLETLFSMVDSKISVILLREEGDDLSVGEVFAKIRGPVKAILRAERVALNFLQHCSGIASMTKRYVDKVQGCCEILDTRKTLPGLRALAKYSVKVGGGSNHRYCLSDRFLIKNNHLSFISKKESRPIFEAVKRARRYRSNLKVEVEVENMEMVKEALDSGADIIMLDNMSVSSVKEAVSKIQKRAYVEASGGISLETVYDYAVTGVDGISIGKLTHSAGAIDISLRFVS